MEKDSNDSIQKIANAVILSFGDLEKYKIRDKKNISGFFLAGAPGAGKTEFLESILRDLKSTFIVIDIDEYRKSFKGYNGKNSSEYQRSSVRVASKVLSFCFKNNLNFIFDGTFRNYNKVKENFNLCLKHKRNCTIALVFQDPRISFYYTFLRKLKNERNVPIEVFIEGFYGSIKNVFLARKNFNKVNLMIANKRYNFMNKEKFTYDIDYQTKDIQTFCRINNIGYSKGDFTNSKKLKIDIIAFNDKLSRQFGGTGGLWMKGKIRFTEKLYKLL